MYKKWQLDTLYEKIMEVYALILNSFLYLCRHNLYSRMQSATKIACKCIILALLFIMGQAGMRAQRVNDSITVALLTCSPGDQVYELYGHTALRITDHTLATDDVFNYGVFNFSQPHFVWNFLLGKTDYMVQPLPYNVFEVEYAMRGSSITSQELNLTTQEKNTLFNNLLNNIRPENREYRYNFLYCNCTTKVRDMIEAAVHGVVVYKEQPKKTYRQALHEFTAGSPWCELGDDLLLGATTDTLLTDRTQMFLPDYYMGYVSEALIYDSLCNSRPMMLGKPKVLLAEGVHPPMDEFPLSPLMCVLLFCAVMFLIAGLEYAFRWQFWFFDLLLMPAVGAAGLLVTFMFLFSEHPAVDSNWQVWVLNPLPLICMPWVVWSAIKRKRCYYHYFNALLLLLFLVASAWIPQQFSSITVLLAVGLLSRPLSYLINFKRLKPKKTRSKK